MVIILFYDIECLPKYWTVVVIDDEKNEKHVFEDIESLREFYKANREQIWTGYNSRQYDSIMIKIIMLDLDPWYYNGLLIDRGLKWFQLGYEVVDKLKRIPLINYDCMVKFNGLKRLEGFMGSSIRETSIPFNTDRQLTRAEKDEIIAYCTHDVLETRKVFYETIKDFNAHKSIIEEFGLQPLDFNKTQAQLAAVILGAKQQKWDDEWELRLPDTLDIKKYKHIVDWYLDDDNHDYDKKLQVDVAGFNHTFGWGGLHGARSGYYGEGEYILADVGSMYPSIIIEYGYLSRNVTEPERYRKLRDMRFVLKKEKNPIEIAYKLILNATFGASKDQFNPLYDPVQANNICIGGQLLLLDLIEHMEPYCEIIQSNTDGILVKVENAEQKAKFYEVCNEWCERTRLTLDYKTYTKVFQKDVNNYLVVQNNGDIKSKGAYVKKLSNIDNDLPIVNKAIIDELVHNIPIEETINNCTELKGFQKIVMVSSKYKHGLHGDKIVPERYMRVFASQDPLAGGIFKVHKLTDKAAKIADTPVSAFIVNDNVNDVLVSDYPLLDKEYYINMARKRIKNFKKAG